MKNNQYLNKNEFSPHHHPHDVYTIPPPPHGRDGLPPNIRKRLIRILYEEKMKKALEDTYGDALGSILSAIERAPAEIRLTISMLLGFRVDLSEYSMYANDSYKIYPSPLLTKAAISAICNLLGKENLENALSIYGTSPAEQVLIAVTVALMMQKMYDEGVDNSIGHEYINFSDLDINTGEFIFQPPPSHGKMMHPHVRHSIVKVRYDDNTRDKLEEIYGDDDEVIDYVLRVIESAPPEIKLTLAMLLKFKVDLSGCTPYVSPKAVKFYSPILSESVKESIGKVLGWDNLDNALFIYNTSPDEQVLIAATIVKMLHKQSSDSQAE